jgi:hypothetical protein
MTDLSRLPQADTFRKLQSETRFEAKKRPLVASLSPDGKHLAYSDGFLRTRLDVVDLATGQSAPGFPRPYRLGDFKWSRPGDRLLYEDKHGIACAEVKTGDTVRMSSIHHIQRPTFSPDENQLATIGIRQQNHGLKGFFRPNYHGELFLIDARSGHIERALDLGDGTTWGTPLYRGGGHEVAALNDRHELAVANLDSGEIRRAPLKVVAGSDKLYDAGPTIVIAGTRQFHLVDADSLQLVDSFDAHTPGLSVGGNLLAARAPAGRVYVIDATRRQTMFSFDGPGTFTVAPDGSAVARVITPEGNTDETTPTRLEVFDPHGRVIASTEEKGWFQPQFSSDAGRMDWVNYSTRPLEVRGLEVPRASG